jgi:hypothetical protein
MYADVRDLNPEQSLAATKMTARILGHGDFTLRGVVIGSNDRVHELYMVHGKPFAPKDA